LIETIKKEGESDFLYSDRFQAKKIHVFTTIEQIIPPISEQFDAL
jgi:hypothetical protein